MATTSSTETTINWSDRYQRHSNKPSVIASSKPSNSLPLEAYRILDAPGLIDDFYLNVLEWGRRDLLGVALGGNVYLWNGHTETVSQLGTVSEEEVTVSALSWIHDGTTLAMARGKAVELWDVERGKRLRMLVHGADRSAALSWNRALLSMGLKDGRIQTHDVRQARSLVSEVHPHTAEVCGLSWSVDGRRLASGGADQQLCIMDPSLNVLKPFQSSVKAIAWCPWQPSLLAVGGGRQDPRISLYDTTTGTCLSSYDTGAQVSAIRWSMHTRELVSAHGYPRAHIAKYRLLANHSLNLLGERESAHQGHRILHACLSPDGQSLVTAGADETLRFWSAFTAPRTASQGSGKQASRRLVMMPLQAGSRATQNMVNVTASVMSPYTQSIQLQ